MLLKDMLVRSVIIGGWHRKIEAIREIADGAREA